MPLIFLAGGNLDIDFETYAMKAIVDPGMKSFILKRIQVPDFKFEEPFSHSVTAIAKCLRLQYYKWKQVKPFVEIFAEIENKEWQWAGNSVEAHIIDRCKQAGIFYGTQVRVKSKAPNLSGAMDLLIKIEDKIYPVEIKSAKQEQYNDWIDYVCQTCGAKLWATAKYCKNCGDNAGVKLKVQKVGKETRPDFEHYCQLQMYFYLVNLAASQYQNKLLNFDEGFIWYYNKNNGEETIHRLHYDTFVIDWQLARVRRLEAHLESNVLPDREFTCNITKNGLGSEGDWQCKFCEYRYNCWSSEIKFKAPDFWERLVKE